MLSSAIRAAALVAIAVMTLTPSVQAEDFRAALVRATEARDRALEGGSIEDWSAALQAFEAACAIERTKEVLFELANAASQLGLDDEAYAAYSESLELGLTGEAARVAQKFLSENESRMAKLTFEAPAGATVRVDGRRRATLPLSSPLLIVAGSREIEVSSDGKEPFHQAISVAPGELRAIRVEAFGQPAPVSSVNLMSAREPLPVGVSLPADQMKPAPPLEQPAAWGLPLVIAGSALAVGGVVTIVLSGRAIDDEHQTLADNCVTLEGDVCQNTTEDKHDDAEEAAERMATLKGVRCAGIAGTAVGVAGAAAGIVRLLTTERGRSASRIDARVSAHEIGAVWTADF